LFFFKITRHRKHPILAPRARRVARAAVRFATTSSSRVADSSTERSVDVHAFVRLDASRRQR
jgi:hypothetical protein